VRLQTEQRPVVPADNALRYCSRAPISAIVTTLNEQKSIDECLSSLQWCDEILLVDSFSDDATVAKALKYDKVRVVQRTYHGAAAQKNWAIDHVRNDWVLILDADERIPAPLRHEIETVLASANPHPAYSIKRQTFVLGKLIRYSGWQHDRVIRLFHRSFARYPNRRVHADMITRCETHVLQAPLVHFMVNDLHEYLQRVTKYSFWGAAQLWREHRVTNASAVLLRSCWRFVRTYLIQAGFRDGRLGLVFCAVQSYGTFVKWATLWLWRSQHHHHGQSPILPTFDDDPRTWTWPDESSPC